MVDVDALLEVEPVDDVLDVDEVDDVEEVLVVDDEPEMLSRPRLLTTSATAWATRGAGAPVRTWAVATPEATSPTSSTPATTAPTRFTARRRPPLISTSTPGRFVRRCLDVPPTSGLLPTTSRSPERCGGLSRPLDRHTV